MCDSIDGKRPRQADPQRQWVRGCQALGRTAKWYRVSFWGDEKVRKLIVEMDAQLCEWRWIVGRANYSSVKLLKKSYRLDYQILSAQGVGGSTGCTGDAVFTKQTSLPWSTDTREPVKQETALGKGFWNWEGPFVGHGGTRGGSSWRVSAVSGTRASLSLPVLRPSSYRNSHRIVDFHSGKFIPMAGVLGERCNITQPQKWFHYLLVWKDGQGILGGKTRFSIMNV